MQAIFAPKMNSQEKISGIANVCRVLSVCLMIFCLLVLTSLNYFVYSPDYTQGYASDAGFGTEDNENDYPPSGPTEEKTAGSGSTVSEEILHELHPEFAFKSLDQLYLHHIAEAENIEMFHPELILPPPKG